LHREYLAGRGLSHGYGIRIILLEFTQLEIVIDLQCQVDVVEKAAPSMVHDQGTRTIGFKNLTHMGSEYKGAVGSFFEQLFVGPAMEALVARCDDLINQIAIEIDRQRQRKRKPRPRDTLIGFVEQLLRRPPKRDAYGAAVLLVAEGRKGLGVLEDRPVVVINPEVERRWRFFRLWSPIVSCKPQRCEHRCVEHREEHNRDGRFAQILDTPNMTRGVCDITTLSYQPRCQMREPRGPVKQDRNKAQRAVSSRYAHITPLGKIERKSR
jgi:hypothetical protein